MYYSLHVHPVPYTHKPDSMSAANISKTIINYNDAIEPKSLAEKLGSGHTVCLGLMKGTRSKRNLISQQIMMLDFDNTVNGQVASGENYVTIDDILSSEWMKQNAAFVYKTFSYKDSWQKFRVVIFLDKLIKDSDEVTATYEWLMHRYPQADKAPKDCSRIFYGGTEVIEINFNNTWAPQQLEKKKVKSSLPKPIKKLSKRQSAQMIKGYINREQEHLSEYGNALSAISVIGKAVLTGEIEEEHAREYVRLLAMGREDWADENEVKLNEFLGKKIDDIYTEYSFAEKFSASGASKGDKFDPIEFADEIVKDLEIYYYKDKIYFKDGVVWSSDENKLLRAFNDITELKKSQDAEVVHQLEKKSPILDTEVSVIQMRNDFHIKGGHIIKGVSEEFTPFLLDVTYDPKAYNADVDHFLDFLVMDRPELRIIVEELLGHILLLKGFPHKVFFLVGEKGGNGKSTFVEMLNAFVGDLGSNVNLESFNDDTSLMALEDKLVNIGDDIDASYLDRSMNFKTLASGNTIMYRPIYSTARRLKNTATLIFTANDMPTFRDKSGGIERRLVIIPCDNVVKHADFEMDDKLSTDEAKSYLLNLALKGVDRIRKNGGQLSKNKIMDQMLTEYMEESDSILSFINNHGINEEVDKTIVYDEYKEYCNDIGVKPQKMATLTKKLQSRGWTVQDTKRLGKRVMLYRKTDE